MADERLSDDAVRMYAGLVTRYRPTEYDNVVQHEGDPREVLARELLALRAERDRMRAVVDAARVMADDAARGATWDALVDALDALDREEASR